MYNATPDHVFPEVQNEDRLERRSGQSPRSTTQRRLAQSLAAIAVLLTGTACTTETIAGQVLSPCPAPSDQSASAVVITATATSAEPLVTLPRSVEALLTDLGRGHSGCGVLVAPGGRSTSVSFTPRREGRIEIGSRREQMRAGVLATTEAVIARWMSNDDGLNLVGAMRAAQKAHPVPGHMVVVSSGVSTVEPVDLRRQGFKADGRAIAAFMKQEGWLDLKGWQVDLVGIGETAGSQPALSEPQQAQLKRMWLSICTAAGATCRVIDADGEPAPPLSRNTVPVVEPPSDQLFPTTTLLDSSMLFRINSDVLSLAADVGLRAIVQRVMRDDLVITIRGRTDASTGTQAGNLDLSRRRAQRVATRLVQLGLPGDRIFWVDGIGSRGSSKATEADQPNLITLMRSVEIGFSRRPQLP